MKFVDEATVRVEAGKGGDGCLSFRREKFVERGGPDGGNGGDGGDIYLVGDKALNTLVDYRYQPRYRAPKGEHGKGSNRTGAGGDDVYLRVPLGTSVFDDDADIFLGDINNVGDVLLVAKGGRHGMGNAHFKSSTNRAPRQTTPGEPGEARNLRLELKLIADVGLLGLPNAGKSTLIRAVSAARPRVADYPFTTLIPNLGVVDAGQDRSFVIADIPGLIEGAADGAGLGVQFLKHLARTRLLLHLVDLLPVDGSDPAENYRVIENEVARYSEGIAGKDRWLVFTKMDLLGHDEAMERAGEIASELGYERRWFVISSVSSEGTKELTHAIMDYLEELDARERDSLEESHRQALAEEQIRQEIHARSLARRAERKAKRGQQDDDDDDLDVKVHYEP